MSHFFEELDEAEDKKNIQKKVLLECDSNDEEDEKMPNKLRKIQELQEEVITLEEKINDGKTIDNFIKQCPKKYKNVLKEGLPKFFENFLSKVVDSKTVSSSIKGKVSKFIQKYGKVVEKEEKKNTEVFKAKPEIKEDEFVTFTLEITNILKKTKIDKIVELKKMLEKTENKTKKLRIQLHILNLYITKSDHTSIRGIYTTIEDIQNIFENDTEQSIFTLNGIDLKSMFISLLRPSIDFLFKSTKNGDYKDFVDLLNKLKKYETFHVEKVLFFLNYYIFHDRNATTDHKIFKILDMLNDSKEDYEKIMFYYKENIEKKDDNLDMYTYEAVKDVGLYVFSRGNYKLSFDILQRYYLNNTHEIIDKTEIENLLNILCVLIEESIVDEPFYDVFIDNMSVMENNEYLLGDQINIKNEIFRAYFYNQNKCHEEAFAILKKLGHFKDDVLNFLKGEEVTSN